MASEYRQLDFADVGFVGGVVDGVVGCVVGGGKRSLEVELKRVQEQIQGKWPVRPEQTVDWCVDQRKD